MDAKVFDYEIDICVLPMLLLNYFDMYVVS